MASLPSVLRSSLLRITAVLAVVAAALSGCTAHRNHRAVDASVFRYCPDLSAVPCVRPDALVAIDIAGTGMRLVYSSDRAAGPAARDTWAGWSLDAVSRYVEDRHEWIGGDGSRRRVEAIQGPRDTRLVADAGGRHVDVFDNHGRFIRTADALTGASLASASYDSKGRLQAVQSSAGVVTVGYGAGKTPTHFTVPNGASTTLESDRAGRPTALVGPAGAGWSFEYDHSGRLATVTDPVNETYRLHYDASGLLSRLDRPDHSHVDVTVTAEKQTSRLRIAAPGGVTELRVQRLAHGHLRRSIVSPGLPDRTETIAGSDRLLTIGDGRRIAVRFGPDPRFRWQVPIPTRQSVSTPAKRTHVIVLRRAAELGTRGDPLSLRRLRDVWSGDVNAATWTYDAASRELTRTTPAGRRSVLRLDSAGSVQDVSLPGLGTTSGTGAVTGLSPGTAVDAFGRPIDIPMDLGTATVDYDAAGRVVAVTPPGRGSYVFGYDPVGQPRSVVPPMASGAALDDLTLHGDGAGRLTAVDVNGARVLSTHYTSGGVLDRARGTGVDLRATADNHAARPTSATTAGRYGISLALSYDGNLVTAMRWSGAVNGSIAADHDAAGHVVAFTVAGNRVPIDRDADGLPKRWGAVGFTRDHASGVVTGYTVGSLTVDVQDDGKGFVVGETVRHAGQIIAAEQLRRDAAERVVAAHDQIGAARHDLMAAYDRAGRLASATVDGGATSYAYDANGNTVARSSGGTSRRTAFDGRDRLISSGDTTYTFDATGRLIRAEAPAGTTRYGYDALGNLRSVVLPSGRRIDYAVDAAGRRVGRFVDGRLVAGWLYADGLRPLAQLDGHGRVRELFAYDDRGDLIAVVRDGHPYAVVTDQRGAPRFVIDAATGTLAEGRGYDAQGRAVSDTAPGFQPFGFNGGLEDPDTHLVHLGTREYDPVTGRFTRPDPAGFAAGDTNLYRFAFGDPVNGRDLSGLDSGGPVSTTGVCIGGSLTFGTGFVGGACFQEFGDNSIGLYEYSGGAVGKDISLGVSVNAGQYVPPAGADPKPGSQVYSGPSLGTSLGVGPVGIEATGPLPGRSGFGSYSAGVGVGPLPFSARGTVYNYSCVVCTAAGGPAGLPFGPLVGKALGKLGQPSSSHGPSTGPGTSGSGEPHIQTFDGTRFDLQAAGEFVALAAPRPGFAVQVRHEPIPGTPVSFISAVAADVNGDRIGIYTHHDIGPSGLWVNGSPVPSGRSRIALPHGGVVTQAGLEISVTWPDGSTLFDRAVTMLLLQPAASRRGQVRGAYGDADGRPGDDLLARDGAAVKTRDGKPDFSDVNGRFADSWRVSRSTSLFDYAPGQSAATFRTPGFPSRAATARDVRGARKAAAERACGNAVPADARARDDCVLDVGVTGDPRYIAEAQLTSAGPLGAAPARQHAITGPSAAPTPTPSSGGGITVGQPVTGHLDRPGEVVSYHFTGNAGTEVLLRHTSGSCAGGELTVRDPMRLPLATALLCEDIGRVYLPVTGTYEIDVGTASTQSVGYGFRVDQPSAPQVFQVRVGGAVRTDDPGPGAGVISQAFGEDEYRFTGTAGQLLDIRSVSAACTLRMRLVGPDGSLVSSSTGICLGLHAVTLIHAGEYRLQVYAGSGTGTYQVELQPE